MKTDKLLSSKITFGMIVLNGEPFIRYNLQALYPFAYQIIVVEGATIAAANVATETFEDHVNMIREVMQTASLTGLTLNSAKCYFKFHEIKFWGHDL